MFCAIEFTFSGVKFKGVQGIKNIPQLALKSQQDSQLIPSGAFNWSLTPILLLMLGGTDWRSGLGIPSIEELGCMVENKGAPRMQLTNVLEASKLDCRMLLSHRHK